MACTRDVDFVGEKLMDLNGEEGCAEVCKWKGVCGVNEAIVELHLPSSNLTGVILTATIGKLKFFIT
nr:hypothetical protein [Tanacetum cinerariifolium]